MITQIPESQSRLLDCTVLNNSMLRTAKYRLPVNRAIPINDLCGPLLRDKKELPYLNNITQYLYSKLWLFAQEYSTQY